MIATARRRFMAALALVVTSNPLSLVSGIHISPLANKTSEVRGGETVYFVDASGLEEEGTDFYQWERLEIQLMETLPVWNIVNLHRIEDHFAGETDDGMIACNLLRHSSNGRHPEKLVGMIHDRTSNLWYEIKPVVEGEVMFSVTHEKDIPPSATDDKHMSELESLWNTFRSFWYYLRDLPWQLRIDPNKEQVIDVMIIWSESSECYRSGQDPDCVLTDETEDNMLAALELTIATTNFALNNSETYAIMNLTHAQRDTSGYREKDTTDILVDMGVPLFGQLSYVHPLRDKYKADLVSFVYDNRIMEEEGIGGRANLPLIPGLPVQPFLAWSCFSAGSLLGYTAAHEWGHNLGCYHDRGTEDACDDKKQTYYGYRSPTGTFRTIMAYTCTSGECDDYQLDRFCGRIPYFSGPATYQNGEELGGEENNCRERIKLDKRSVSRFR